MPIWLFQANKNDYNLVERVPLLLEEGDWWTVKQHLDKLKSEQVALFWQSGEQAGVYAVGKLASEPYQEPLDGKSEWRVDVQYEQLLPEPVLKADLVTNPLLRSLDILQREWSKNPFRVKDDEWSALQTMLPRDAEELEPPRSETARIADLIQGEKLYQERARAALPLLVRQAEAGVPIFYSDLAEELNMPNPRNLNYVLGSIGQTLERLSEEWGEKIPPIQCLVVNKNTGLPGPGIGWFLLKEEEFSALPLRQKRELVNAELQRIYLYQRWRDVLHALSLAPAETHFADIVDAARKSFGGGGESLQHMALKQFIANHPEIIGLGSPIGETEIPLPSGDCLDVSFVRRTLWVAVEVKSSISDDADITRGIFQCVKYLAVMEAQLKANSQPQNARAVLVLEGQLSQRLVSLKNLLGVEVIEGVKPLG